MPEAVRQKAIVKLEGLAKYTLPKKPVNKCFVKPLYVLIYIETILMCISLHKFQSLINSGQTCDLKCIIALNGQNFSLVVQHLVL